MTFITDRCEYCGEGEHDELRDQPPTAWQLVARHQSARVFVHCLIYDEPMATRVERPAACRVVVPWLSCDDELLDPVTGEVVLTFDQFERWLARRFRALVRADDSQRRIMSAAAKAGDWVTYRQLEAADWMGRPLNRADPEQFPRSFEEATGHPWRHPLLTREQNDRWHTRHSHEENVRMITKARARMQRRARWTS